MPHAKMPWSFTASSDPQSAADELVVCCLSLGMLGIDDLAAEIDDPDAGEEGLRWHRARAQEYGTRLLAALRMHLPRAEVIVHIDDADPTERVRVVLPAGPQALDREVELRDRVDAIRKRTWMEWHKGLHITMASLRDLAEADANRHPAPAPAMGAQRPG